MFPEGFTRNVATAWGDAGRDWLAGLPALIDAVARDWRLTVGAPYPLSFNWVAPVRTADGSPAVLKLGVPTAPDLASEAGALSFFAGAGAAALLNHDRDRGALLLERVEPGRTLRTLVREHDEQATAVLVAMMRRLHRPAPPGLPCRELATYGDEFAAYLRRFPGDGPIPRRLVERAAGLFGELCASAPRRVVLHGDLHHENVLAGTREPWLAIDPHGVLGDPGYEIGAVLYNPFDGDEPVLDLLPARVEQFADGLAMPVERVVAWGFVQAVLSEVWSAGDAAASPGQARDVALSLQPRLS
ncbi:aminoglycoside phosphotransferase family protein [Amorphoplanes digitatis]|uniref:Streptomycin 6-kinase n=1 Tax=Actinoplanes digitatis TaxID=1868 RepID=A0A7W7HYH9_9ACTN|nr:aminoglycoside phosphotransferase family protein [Actinoplanes digitatis]MBB4763031.1 streptomycin 6-kinase [Actinoplanes digitatis]GID95768.1 hydroxyurea phosphotransferase [Actinoplanes digitatis]